MKREEFKTSCGGQDGAETQARTDPAQLVANYHDLNVDPETKANRLMVVGTGGTGLWERQWSKLATEGAGNLEGRLYELYQAGEKQAGPMRAMCFATDEARIHEAAIRDIEMSAYQFTDEGDRQRDQFNRQLAGNGVSYLVRNQADTTMESFVEHHGERWGPIMNELGTAAADMVQFGKHLTALGIHQEDEDLIAIGQNTMEHAARWLTDQVENPGGAQEALEQCGRTGEKWPAIGEDASHLGTERHREVRTMARILGQGSEDLTREAADFTATATVARDAAQLRRQNIELLHELGSKDGGVASLMRKVSDETFSNQSQEGASTLSKAAQDLSEGTAGETAQAYTKMAALQEGMLAVAYRERHTEHRPAGNPKWLHQLVEEGGTADEMETNIREHLAWRGPAQSDGSAAGDLAEQMRRECELNLEQAVVSLRPTIENGWNHGDFRAGYANYTFYHYRQGAITATAGAGEDPAGAAVEFSRSHPEWESFKKGETRYQDC